MLRGWNPHVISDCWCVASVPFQFSSQPFLDELKETTTKLLARLNSPNRGLCFCACSSRVKKGLMQHFVAIESFILWCIIAYHM